MLNKKPAFTIVELIMIIVVMGILAGVAGLSFFSSQSAIRLDAAARKVEADLRYIRNLSLSTSKWYGVFAEQDPVNVYSVYQTDGTNDIIIEDPAKPGSQMIVNVATLYPGVEIINVDFDGTDKIEFSPLGTPHTDKNGTMLVGLGLIELEYNGQIKSVQISPNTGTVNIQ